MNTFSFDKLQVEREVRREQKHQSVLDSYDRLVLWYLRRSPLVKHGSLLLFSVLLLATLYMAATAKVDPIPYRTYTPTLWVLAVVSYLPFAFALRYDSNPLSEQQVTALVNMAEKASLAKWFQLTMFFGTLVVLGIEAYLIAHGNSVSSILRQAALANAVLYWVGGVVAGFFIGCLTDLRGLPQLTKLTLALWIATCAHVYWWITPK